MPQGREPVVPASTPWPVSCGGIAVMERAPPPLQPRGSINLRVQRPGQTLGRSGGHLRGGGVQVPRPCLLSGRVCCAAYKSHRPGRGCRLLQREQYPPGPCMLRRWPWQRPRGTLETAPGQQGSGQQSLPLRGPSRRLARTELYGALCLTVPLAASRQQHAKHNSPTSWRGRQGSNPAEGEQPGQTGAGGERASAPPASPTERLHKLAAENTKFLGANGWRDLVEDQGGAFWG